jgi:hypothetical protein
MRQMTLRDIPEEVEMVARNEASRKGFLTLLRKGMQQTKVQTFPVTSQSNSTFSRFCGVWSEEDAAEFDNALSEQRKIDDEAWQ